MNRIKRSLLSLLLISPLSLLAATYPLGNLTLTPVADATFTFPTAIFPTVSNATLAQTMPGGSSPGSVTTFLLKTKSGQNILFDAGLGKLGNPSSQLLQNLKTNGISPADISIVLLTHMHFDHIGGLLDENGSRLFPNAKIRCSQKEFDFWTNPQSLQTLLKTTPPENAGHMKQQFSLVEKVRAAYGSDFLPPFDFNQNPIPTETSITALDAVGHTPGHTAYLIESNGTRLMIIGDLLHVSSLQFSHPEAASNFDMDPVATVAARRRILDKAAAEKIPVAAMHLPAPLGTVAKTPDSTYTFTPLP